MLFHLDQKNISLPPILKVELLVDYKERKPSLAPGKALWGIGKEFLPKEIPKAEPWRRCGLEIMI